MAPLPHSPQAPRPGLARYSRALLLAAPLVLAACGGGSDDPGIAVAPSDFAVDYSPKGYTFHWSARTGATRYELFEDPDGAAGPLPEVQIGGTIASTSYAHSLAGQLLHERVNASYRLRACDANGCGAWTAALTPDLTQALVEDKQLGRSLWNRFTGPAVELFADDVGAQTAEERRSAELDARAVLIMAAGAAMYVSTIAADDDSTELEERIVELLTTGYRAVAANRPAPDGQA